MRLKYSLFHCQTFHNTWVKFSSPVLWFNSVDLMHKIKGVLEVFETGEFLLNSKCKAPQHDPQWWSWPQNSARTCWIIFASCTCLISRLAFFPPLGKMMWSQNHQWHFASCFTVVWGTPENVYLPKSGGEILLYGHLDIGNEEVLTIPTTYSQGVWTAGSKLFKVLQKWVTAHLQVRQGRKSQGGWITWR